MLTVFQALCKALKTQGQANPDILPETGPLPQRGHQHSTGGHGARGRTNGHFLPQWKTVITPVLGRSAAHTPGVGRMLRIPRGGRWF